MKEIAKAFSTTGLLVLLVCFLDEFICSKKISKAVKKKIEHLKDN